MLIRDTQIEVYILTPIKTLSRDKDKRRLVSRKHQLPVCVLRHRNTHGALDTCEIRCEIYLRVLHLIILVSKFDLLYEESFPPASKSQPRGRDQTPTF